MKLPNPVSASASVGIPGLGQGLWRRPQGRGEFGEGPRYDVQVAVHGPQLHQDVPDAGFQTGGRGRPGAERWGGSGGLGALLPACCSRMRGGCGPLPLIPTDAGRGGHAAAGQPVAKARGSVGGGDDDRVEACASRGTRDGGRGGSSGGGGRRQQRGQD